MTLRMELYEVPVAASVLQSAKWLVEQNRDFDPSLVFLWYWAAFNNIYTTYADKPEFCKKPREERDMIKRAIEGFDTELRRDLIKHESTKFFVNRTPRWWDQTIEKGKDGRKLNGVLNVGYTTSPENPKCHCIDIKKYTACMAGTADSAAVSQLSRQIVLVLYGVRNNLFHGGKRYDDANDKEVLENAIPLLKMIVECSVK